MRQYQGYYDNYNNSCFNESTEQSNDNYNPVQGIPELLQSNTDGLLPTSALNGYQLNANVGLERDQNFTSLPTSHLNEEICSWYICQSCGNTLDHYENTKLYCSNCISRRDTTNQGQFLQGNPKAVSESKFKHQYNAALQNSTKFPVAPHSNQPSSTSNCEDKQQIPSPSISKNKKGLLKNNDRKISDRVYTKSKNDLYITLARRSGKLLPHNFEFSKQQSVKDKDLSIKGILQGGINRIEKCELEILSLTGKNEKLETKVKELEDYIESSLKIFNEKLQKDIESKSSEGDTF